ncbi:MAG: flagellar brake protein [Methylococcaceae bacterium]
MLNAFKKLLNLSSTSSAAKQSSQSSNSNFLTDASEITALLNKLQAAMLPCSVYINNTTEKFLSEIIDINVSKNTFTLDELRPPDGNALIAECKSIKIVFFFNGVDISFSINPPENSLNLGNTKHILPIPSRVYSPKTKTASNSFDVQTFKIPFEGFSATSKLLVIGHAADISDESISANLAHNKILLERGDLLKKCHIILPSGKQIITFDLILDIVNQPLTSNAKTFISGHFENMSNKDELIYEQFIRKIEHDDIKKRNA